MNIAADVTGSMTNISPWHEQEAILTRQHPYYVCIHGVYGHDPLHPPPQPTHPNITPSTHPLDMHGLLAGWLEANGDLLTTQAKNCYAWHIIHLLPPTPVMNCRPGIMSIDKLRVDLNEENALVLKHVMRRINPM